eukprot:gene31800-34513_t
MTATADLDGDGKCSYTGRIDASGNDNVPSGEVTWRMYCDGSWTDSTLSIGISTSCVSCDSNGECN